MCGGSDLRDGCLGCCWLRSDEMGQAFWDILNVLPECFRMFLPGYFHCVGSVLALCRAGMMFLLELRAVILAAVVWDC